MKTKIIRRRIIAFLTAIVMIMTTILPTGLNFGTAKAAGEEAGKHISDTGLADPYGTGANSSDVVTLADRATVTFTIDAITVADLAADVYDSSGRGYTARYTGNSWTSGSTTGGRITAKSNESSEYLSINHVYEVSAYRNGRNITITYKDVTTGTTQGNYQLTGCNISGNVFFHVNVIDGEVVVYNSTASAANRADLYDINGVFYGTNKPKTLVASLNNGARSSDFYFDSVAVYTVVEKTENGSFRASVKDTTNSNNVLYITTQSNGDAWYSPDNLGDEIYGNVGGVDAVKDHVYLIVATKINSNYTIYYFDYTDGKVLQTFHADNTKLTGSSICLYIKAERGSVDVYKGAPVSNGFVEGDEIVTVTPAPTNRPAVSITNHGVDRTRKVTASQLKTETSIPADYAVNPATQGKAQNGDYEKYFLKDDLQTVNINIDANNLDYVLQNAGSEAQALADSVTIGKGSEAETVSYVSLKTKGNVTRTGEAIPSSSDRFSFTVNFGKYIKKKYGYTETQNFHGLSKVSFNNFCYDKTMLKEYNAFRFMHESGLPAPQYGLCRLYINGEYYGVYCMLESFDETIMKNYYGTSNVSSFFTKPISSSPTYNANFAGLDSSYKEADGTYTLQSLMNKRAITQNADGTYNYSSVINQYSGLWGGKTEDFQDVVEDLPAAMTWVDKLMLLHKGKDFSGKTIDVNSDEYIELLEQVYDVDEVVRYFATHSFVAQMDNMFTWRQNYGLYVGSDARALVTPWDYDLSFGYKNSDSNKPANAEELANYNIDMLYNNVANGSYRNYTTDLTTFYSAYPMFYVIFQNKSLMERMHTYMLDCAKRCTLGGTTSDGVYYEPGRFQKTLDEIYDKVIEAASEPLASNAYYLHYTQPEAAKIGNPALKCIIAKRAAGVFLQVNGIQATITGYGYSTGALGLDAERATYTTSGNNIGVVDDNTGVFVIANYASNSVGPQLTVKELDSGHSIYANIEDKIKSSYSEEKLNNASLKVYSMSDTRTPSSNYRVFLPTGSTKSQVFSYSGGNLTELSTKVYDGHTCEVTTSSIQYMAVLESDYEASFVKDEGVESIDVYYTHDYSVADETDVTTTIPRDDETSETDVYGVGQVNFKVNVKPGYKIKNINVTPADNYNNIKLPSETGKTNVYRVTKITGDIVINIETEVATEFIVTFDKTGAAGISSIDTYNTGVYGAAPDNKNVTTAIAKDSETGATLVDGNGQVNFKVNLEPGYKLLAVYADANYKNIKTPDETAQESTYRITKISGDVTVTFKTIYDDSLTATSKYKASFTGDLGVAGIDVFYTQDYDYPVDRFTSVSDAYAYGRSSDTGLIDVTGNGQINFRVNIKDGYELLSVKVTPSGTYKNIKGSVDTGIENVYRITKMTGNFTVVITTEKIVEEHVFDKEIATEQFLKSAATCTAPAYYYKSCECGEKGEETFSVGGALGHNWDAGTVITPATYTSTGTIEYRCKNDSSHTYNAVIPMLDPTPTPAPTAAPTAVPTVKPTSAPTVAPTEAPVIVPTIKPEPTTKPSGGAQQQTATPTTKPADTQQAGNQQSVDEFKAQIITTAKIKAVKVKKLKKKKLVIKLKAKTTGNGKLKYTNSTAKKLKKYIKVSKKGKVTLKKGAKKGTYKITIIASKTGTYSQAKKVIKIKVK